MVLKKQEYTVDNVIQDVKCVESPPPDPINEKFYEARKVIPERFSSTRRVSIFGIAQKN